MVGAGVAAGTRGVQGLVPAMRRRDELVERFHSRQALQRPIEHHAEQMQRLGPRPRPHDSPRAGDGGRAPAQGVERQVRRRHGEAGVRPEVDRGQHDHRRHDRAVQVRGGDRLGQGQRQGHGVARLAGDGAAQADGDGLHVSLDPARPLREPLSPGGRSRLPGGPVDHAEPVAGGGQAKADVGVLGHVVRVPPALVAQDGGPEVRYYVANTPTGVATMEAANADLCGA